MGNSKLFKFKISRNKSLQIIPKNFKNLSNRLNFYHVLCLSHFSFNIFLLTNKYFDVKSKIRFWKVCGIQRKIQFLTYKITSVVLRN